MTKSYTAGAALGRRLRQLGLTALLAGGTALAGHAQTLNYLVSGATNVATTYTDLGTTGTPIIPANTDDANSGVQAIGFTFSYNNLSFTQFTPEHQRLYQAGCHAPFRYQSCFFRKRMLRRLTCFKARTTPTLLPRLTST